MTEEIKGQKNNEEGKVIPIAIGITLDKDIDIKKAQKCLDRLFLVANKISELLTNEGITPGESLLISYLLEKGILSTFCQGSKPNEVYEMLLADNKFKIDMIINPIVKSGIESIDNEKEKSENK